MQNDAFYADLTLRETLTVPYVINALLLLPPVTLLYRHLLSLLQAQNLSFHSRDQTGLTMLLDLFLVRIFVNFSVCSVWWIHVSFLLHVKYTVPRGGYTSALYCTLNTQYRVVSYSVLLSASLYVSKRGAY